MKPCNYPPTPEPSQLATIRKQVERWRSEANATIEELHKASNTGAYKARIDKISGRVAAYSHVLDLLPGGCL